jgi:hypothetical protein
MRQTHIRNVQVTGPFGGGRSAPVCTARSPEDFNGFSGWPRFGNDGVIADNDRPSRRR